MKFLTLLLLSLLLNGCSVWSSRTPTIQHPSESESIQQVEKLRKERRYNEAENLLRQRQQIYPGSTKLRELLEPLLNERRRERQLIEDQLLITRLTMQHQQLPLLSQLAKSESDDLIITSNLRQMEREWLRSRRQLSACGERRLKNAPDTAEKCLRLALAIEENESDRTRLTQIENNRADVERKAQQAKKTAQINQLLEQAHSRRKNGEHYSALILLKQILRLEPKSNRALKLKEKITRELSGYTQSILTAGETLYQKGQLKGAIAAWNTLLLLDPKHQQAREKIERTQRVLDNLQQMREEQQPVSNQ